MKISVVAAVYNSRNYIRKCIESICQQTYTELEIIVVDDGSDDGTAEICDEIALEDSRIRVIHVEHKGVLNARRIGYEESSGKHVSIVDGDDYLEPDMIERLYEGIVNNNAEICMCGRIEESDSGQKNVKQGFKAGLYDRVAMEETIFPGMISNGDFFSWGIFPSLWDKLIKRELLEEPISRYTDMFPIGNDAVVAYPAVLKANSIEIIDDCLYHYQQNNSSMVHNTSFNSSIRDGYKRLYNALSYCFSGFDFDKKLWRQWTEYILFLMIPRATDMYKGMAERDELFPFEGVKKGSKVIIYGMGLYGKRLYRFFEDTGYCQVVAAVDREYKSISCEDMLVESPECIKEKNYDAVILTLSYAVAREAVTEYLLGICPKEKIHAINLDIATLPENMQALGLI